MTKPWQSDKWYVSPFNYHEEVRKKYSPPKRVVFHDVTLRDGEQQAGVIFSKYDKVVVGKALDRARVDRIEVGTPGTSNDDREAMRSLVAATLDAELYSWCRNNRLDITAAKECGSGGVTIEIPASSLMIEETYSTTVEELLRTLSDNAQYAKSEGLKVLFLLVDATRSDTDLLSKIIKETERYCDSIAISDTFGTALPDTISFLVSRLKNVTDKPLEIHCHNDFGLATANTLAAVAAGASGVHVTVNGMGERAGNTPLGEVAVGIKLLLGLDSNIRLNELYRLSNLVAQYSGFPVPPNKPLVGANIFKVESAQAAQWVATGKEGVLAYPFSKELVGNPEFKIILSKKSGPHNLTLKLRELGIEVPQEKYPEILGMVYERSVGKKGALTDEEFLEILQDLGLYQYKVEDLMRA
ncbi:MAG: homocitrate synthase/isopropylmalate synthase family protein [Candidatus Methanomethylicaceae archaeon]